MIKTLNKKEYYKYFGILKDSIKQNEMKARVEEEYFIRTK